MVNLDNNVKGLVRVIPSYSSHLVGMIERFNGRIQEVPDTNSFDSLPSLEETLTRYVLL